MSDTKSAPTVAKSGIEVVICVGSGAFARLRPVIRHLCVGLIDHGVRLRLITTSPEAESLVSLGPLEVFLHRDLGWPLHKLRVRQLIDALSPRPPMVIHAISSGSYQLSAELAAAFDTDVVAQVTGARDVDLLHLVPTPQLAHIIGASEPLLGMVRQRGALSSIDNSLVRPGVLRGSELTCFRDSEATPSLVCTANFDDRSGVDVVLEAAALIRDRGLALLTFLLGTGNREPALRRIVRARNLASEITFARPSGDMTEVLRGADMYVLPPGDEDIFARPLQAMASGTAVICFSGGMADCFHSEDTAIVCADRSAEALADALERLLRDHALAQRVADSARAYVKEHHQMSTMAELTVRVLERVALRRKTFRIPS